MQLKLILLFLIWVTLIFIASNDVTIRLTEVKHIYHIKHYYGDLSFNKEKTNVNP